jgi:ubiquitin C-terminal hydrolase
LVQNNQQQMAQKENEVINKMNEKIQNMQSQNNNLKNENQNLKNNIQQQNEKENQYKKEIENLLKKIKELENKQPIQPNPPGPIYPMLSKFKKTPGIGLANIGSTCYMNATLQCFTQTAPFTDYFLNPDHKDIIIKGKFVIDPNKPRLSEAYYEVVQNLWPLNNPSSAKYFEPRRFKLVLGTLNELFKKMEASDAKDMIVFFLEQIHKEINLIKPPDVNDQSQNPDQYNRDVMINHFINEFAKSNKSIISDHFFTIAETTQKCQNCFRMNVPNYICYNYSIQNCFIFPLEEIRKFRDNNINQKNMNNQFMMQNMGMNPMMPNMGMNPMMQNMGLNPMMPNMGLNPMMQNMGMNPMMQTMDPNYNTNKVTIYDCFNFNQKDELMCGDNQIFCNKCRQNSDSIYGNKIFTLPNILIMILNRGKDNMYKVNIDFPMEIDLSNYVLSNINKTEKYIYSIYGVITHMGDSGEGGHFIAACKSPIDSKWYRYNDAFVSPIKDFNKDVTNFNTPYILFYHRKK